MEQNIEKIGRDIGESLKQILREYTEALVLAVVLALLVRHFLLASYKVTSESMAPHLLPGDYIIGFKAPYGSRLPFTDVKLGKARPKRGDVAIINCEEAGKKPLCIKRVLGLPGDRLEIVEGHLIRNGQTIAEVGFPTQLRLTQVVPPDMYFVSSDRFGHSANHFEWGLVSGDRFEARALLIWFPSARFGQMIH